MHHRIDIAIANHLGDERIANVSAHELSATHPAQHVFARCDRVDRDYAFDQWILREPSCQVATEKSARASDQHHLGVMQSVVADTARSGTFPTRGIHLNSVAAKRDTGVTGA
jgi:hypothetical protein